MTPAEALAHTQAQQEQAILQSEHVEQLINRVFPGFERLAADLAKKASNDTR